MGGRPTAECGLLEGEGGRPTAECGGDRGRQADVAGGGGRPTERPATSQCGEGAGEADRRRSAGRQTDGGVRLWSSACAA